MPQMGETPHTEGAIARLPGQRVSGRMPPVNAAPESGPLTAVRLLRHKWPGDESTDPEAQLDYPDLIPRSIHNEYDFGDLQTDFGVSCGSE